MVCLEQIMIGQFKDPILKTIISMISSIKYFPTHRLIYRSVRQLTHSIICPLQYLLIIVMNNKELVEIRQQLKKQILDLDHQIFQLQTFYIEDTREYGNLLKGFDNYIASKTARNQPTNKKQKVENFQRLFSLSSIKSKTSQLYEEFNLNDPTTKIVLESNQITQKRNRGINRNSGMNKGGGKTVNRDQPHQDDDQNSISADNMYSVEESAHNKGPQKRKKINKTGGKSIMKKT